jgi:nucleoside phosphorylase
MLKLLVTAAWEPELVALRAAVRGGGPELDGVDVVFATLGVGVVEASFGMALALEAHRDANAAIFVGTAGALPGPSSPALLEVVVGASVHLVDVACLMGEAETPAPMPTVALLDEVLTNALASDARRVRVANTLGVTVDDGVAMRLAEHASVEHLEAFAFARGCARAGVPAGVVLAIANGVGARGRAEWRANHEQASALAAGVVWASLPQLRSAVGGIEPSPKAR